MDKRSGKYIVVSNIVWCNKIYIGGIFIMVSQQRFNFAAFPVCHSTLVWKSKTSELNFEKYFIKHATQRLKLPMGTSYFQKKVV